jgi:diguanylate cyclase (GGDEF)-like protein
LRIYHLADKSSVSGLDFEGLMRFVVRQRRFLSHARFNAYVKKRANEVRAGIEDPRDIRMDDGQVIRVNCKTLPAGGRMLVYADVTDLVQQADRLKEMAAVDGMTGVFNRRHFLSLAEIEWGRYQRYRRPMSLLMLDIDRFKSINDRFGHAAGDHVIVQIAEMCRHERRKSDVVARFGGRSSCCCCRKRNCRKPTSLRSGFDGRLKRATCRLRRKPSRRRSASGSRKQHRAWIRSSTSSR